MPGAGLNAARDAAAVAILAVGMLAACAVYPPVAGGRADDAAGEWQALFDGATKRGWRNVGVQTLDPRWQVRDGALTLTAAGGGDIVSVDRFDDFELVVEWRIAQGGNSGIFYRAADRAPLWHDTAEMQVLDDERAEDRHDPSHRAGAVYDLVAPEAAAVRPANTTARASSPAARASNTGSTIAWSRVTTRAATTGGAGSRPASSRICRDSRPTATATSACRTTATASASAACASGGCQRCESNVLRAPRQTIAPPIG